MKGETGRPCFICFGCGMYRWKASILTGNSLLEKGETSTNSPTFRFHVFFWCMLESSMKIDGPTFITEHLFPNSNPQATVFSSASCTVRLEPWTIMLGVVKQPERKQHSAKLMRWRCFLNMKVFRSEGLLIKAYLEDGWGWAPSGCFSG